MNEPSGVGGTARGGEILEETRPVLVVSQLGE